jgi:micrococcal nuclease
MAKASRPLILLSLLLTAAVAGPGREAKVLHVADGDTIKVRLEGREEMVRLLCIDTPERGDPWFKESSDFLAGLIDGKTVGRSQRIL